MLLIKFDSMKSVVSESQTKADLIINFYSSLNEWQIKHVVGNSAVRRELLLLEEVITRLHEANYLVKETCKWLKVRILGKRRARWISTWAADRASGGIEVLHLNPDSFRLHERPTRSGRRELWQANVCFSNYTVHSGCIESMFLFHRESAVASLSAAFTWVASQQQENCFLTFFWQSVIGYNSRYPRYSAAEYVAYVRSWSSSWTSSSNQVWQCIPNFLFLVTQKLWLLWTHLQRNSWYPNCKPNASYKPGMPRVSDC